MPDNRQYDITAVDTAIEDGADISLAERLALELPVRIVVYPPDASVAWWHIVVHAGAQGTEQARAIEDLLTPFGFHKQASIGLSRRYEVMMSNSFDRREPRRR